MTLILSRLQKKYILLGYYAVGWMLADLLSCMHGSGVYYSHIIAIPVFFEISSALSSPQHSQSFYFPQHSFGSTDLIIRKHGVVTLYVDELHKWWYSGGLDCVDARLTTFDST